MVDEASIAEHELGTVVSELEKHAHPLAKVPEEQISRFPAQYKNTEHELQAEAPQHRPPAHLTTSQRICTLTKQQTKLWELKRSLELGRGAFSTPSALLG